MSGVDEIAIVIPVRNEEELLQRCLDSLSVAEWEARHMGARVRIVAVLDRCSDRSVEIAVSDGAEPVFSTAGRVGVTRGLGVAHALKHRRVLYPHKLWIANTDADSVVPANWITEQLRLAAGGYDLVVGAVEPDPDDLSAVDLLTWRSQHDFDADHPHVFGANLGVRASAYVAVGGFADVATGEDVALVAALRAAGVPEVRTSEPRVTTSGRSAGRAIGGFADYIAAL
ncbi:glycosyltransferase family 2 protein [soil metagenome]